MTVRPEVRCFLCGEQYTTWLEHMADAHLDSLDPPLSVAMRGLISGQLGLLQAADLAILVLDRSTPPNEEEKGMALTVLRAAVANAVSGA